jgi:hypothetical protein
LFSKWQYLEMRFERPNWSWAPDQRAAAAYQAEAERLVGEIVTKVRYFNIDYFALKSGRETDCAREIQSAEEWVDPTWAYVSCDSVDFAVELMTQSDRFFTVSWESPGTREGIGLRELSALGNAVAEDHASAVWDVSDRSRWQQFVGGPVRNVKLKYEPWGHGKALWCTNITIAFDDGNVSFELAECSKSDPALVPSVDNIAVMFESTALESTSGN